MEESNNTPAPIGEISHGPSSFERFLDEHQKKLLILAAAAVVAAIMFIIFSGIREAKLEAAGNALLAAEDAQALENVVANHSNTPSAGSALVLLADKQWEEDKKDESLATLQRFTNEFSDHPATTAAKLSLGSRQAELGKLDEATATLQPLTDNPETKFAAPVAFVILGDIAKEQGKLDEAQRYYEQARDNFEEGGPSISSTAKQRLDQLRADDPVAVAAPEPEAKVETPAIPAALTPAPQAPTSVTTEPIQIPAPAKVEVKAAESETTESAPSE